MLLLGVFLLPVILQCEGQSGPSSFRNLSTIPGLPRVPRSSDDIFAKICINNGVVESANFYDEKENLTIGCFKITVGDPYLKDTLIMNLAGFGIKKFKPEWYKFRKNNIKFAISHWDLGYNQLVKFPMELLTEHQDNTLITVLVDNNKILELKEEFPSCLYLTVNFSSNRIRNIANGTFQNATIHILDLSNNQLGNGEFLESLWKGVTFVDLRENNITEVPAGTFTQSGLSVLDLGNNEIQELQANRLHQFAALKLLGLQSNGLRLIEPGAFRGLQYLTYLDLQNNKIFNLTEGVFEGLDSIRAINMSSNLFETIQSSMFLDACQTLNDIYLFNNPIKTIEENGFQCPTLETLYLDRNVWQTFRNKSVLGLNNVEIIVEHNSKKYPVKDETIWHH